MKKTKKTPDALDHAIRSAREVERLALRVRAVMDMPTGTPALDAAQDAAMAAVDREMAALRRFHARGPR